VSTRPSGFDTVMFVFSIVAVAVIATLIFTGVFH
jgi:hypothetical protein